MRVVRLFERPHGAYMRELPLMVVGSLPFYTVGEDYEGRLDIVNPIGRCKVRIIEEATVLPKGASAHVDNFNQQVVLRWPAYTPPDTERFSIINGDFETGDLTAWNDVRGTSWAVEPYSWHNAGPTNRAAVMRGTGRGDHVLESIKYEVQPGLRISASSLWDQGPSNKDNNNLWTAFGIWRNDYFMREERGDRIHDRTNKQRHRSTIDLLVPATATHVTVRLIAHRRNGRNREIIVDDVLTSGLSYMEGTDTEEDYFVTLEVTDSAGRTALWSGPVFFRSVFLTSAPYPIITSDSLSTGFSAQAAKTGALQYDSAESSFSLLGVTLRETVAYKTLDGIFDVAESAFSLQRVALIQTTGYKTLAAPTDSVASGFALRGVTLTVTTAYVSTAAETEALQSSFALRGITLT